MTDAILSLAVLARVAELLRELSAADVTALAEGRARLAVLPVDSDTPTPRTATSGAGHARTAIGAAAPAGDPPGAVEALAAMAARADGTAYLSSWAVKDLRTLAMRLELRGVAGLRKAELVERIVDRTIGFRLNSTAIRQL
jgi:hypothetical protein